MASHPSQVRFIHSSDWQLGMTRAFLTPEAGARFAQARIDAIGSLGAAAAEQGAQFIVVAGDVFESNQLSRQVLLRTLDALQNLPVPVFLLPGNHDPLDGTSLFNTPEFRQAPNQVIVLDDYVPRPVPGVPGAQVVGAPWLSKAPNRDLVAEMSRELEPAADLVRIAVAHGQVDEIAPDTSLPELIGVQQAEQALAEGLFHYLALGDRHSVFDVGRSGRIWYSGATVATAFTEDRPNHALLVEMDGAKEVAVTPVPIGDWHFVEHHQLLNREQDLEQFAQWLSALPSKQTTAVKVSFEGSVNLELAGELDALMLSQQELFASLRQRDRLTQLAIVPNELDQDSLALQGYARAAWNELLAQAEQSDAVAQDALRLFYRLARPGS